jgi:hypothetical protein
VRVREKQEVDRSTGEVRHRMVEVIGPAEGRLARSLLSESVGSMAA